MDSAPDTLFFSELRVQNRVFRTRNKLISLAYNSMAFSWARA